MAKKAETSLLVGVVEVRRADNERVVGLGFLAAGRHVITAAHNLAPPESPDGLYTEDIHLVRVANGEWGEVTPVFVDRCADLAVLVPPDDLSDFTMQLDSLPPLPIVWHPIMGGDQSGGALFTHDRGLVPASYDVDARHTVGFTANTPIASGTSGGPLFDRSGAVLTVVSQSVSGQDETHREGWGPSIGQCLPRRLAHTIAHWERANYGLARGVKRVSLPTDCA